MVASSMYETLYSSFLLLAIKRAHVDIGEDNTWQLIGMPRVPLDQYT